MTGSDFLLFAPLIIIAVIFNRDPGRGHRGDDEDSTHARVSEIRLGGVPQLWEGCRLSSRSCQTGNLTQLYETKIFFFPLDVEMYVSVQPNDIITYADRWGSCQITTWS